MYQKQDLFNGLDEASLNETLKACELPDKDEYLDTEAEKIRLIRTLVEQGNTYAEASEKLRSKQSASGLKERMKSKIASPSVEHHLETPSSSPSNEEKLSNIAELLSQVKEITGTRVSLAEAAKILSVCGLDERDYYSPTDSKRFIEACKLFRENRPTAANIIGDAAALSEDGLLDLVEKVTGKRAENIPEMVNQIYMQKVSEQLEDSKSKIQDFYAGLEEQVLARIEGKSRRRSIMEAAWIPNSLNTSVEKPMVLPPESES